MFPVPHPRAIRGAGLSYCNKQPRNYVQWRCDVRGFRKSGKKPAGECGKTAAPTLFGKANLLPNRPEVINDFRR
jgi:hypothetical protein